jgi:anti-sigma-K factor RskA
MRDDLLGFVLGALDASEHEQIQQRLEQDAHLRERLERIRRGLRRIDWERQQVEPPAGLAARTCQLVERITDPPGIPPAAALRNIRGLTPASRSERSADRSRWTMPDVVVAAGVCLAMACLLLPAIHQSRNRYLVELCANRQRNVFLALDQYSSDRGYFPVIPASGNAAVAGVYATKLLELELVRDASDFVCPAATGSRLVVGIPTTMQQIYSAQGPQLWKIYHAMGKNYAYRFPPVINGHLQRVRNQGRTGFALLSDVPLMQSTNSAISSHGRGQNVLFEDGHVGYLTSRWLRNDDLFLNHWGLVEAPLDPDDCVLAPSYSSPLPRIQSVGATIAAPSD